MRGHPHVLQSYEAERCASAKNIIDVAAKLVRSTVSTAKEYVGLIEQNAGYITGMGVSYPPCAPMIAGAPLGLFVPGQRCPDLYLHLHQKAGVEDGGNGDGALEPRRMYTVADYSKFIVLVADEGMLPGAAAKVWRPYVRFWVAGKAESAQDSRSAENAIQRFSHMTEDGVSLRVEYPEGGCIVIRPDMYTGYAGDDAEGYLDGVFNNGT